MLSDRARVILFWFTIGMIILVAAVAVVTILRGCSGPSSTEPSLSVFPAEITLCVGEQQQFTAGEDAEVTWDASGGTISESGAFTASEPGDYTVTAARSGTRRKAEAVAHVTACTPTPTPMPSPTPAPTPTPAAVPPTAPPPADPSGDVVAYEGGTPVEQVPAGSDIRAASLGQDLSVDLQPGEQIPDELATWAAEGELLLWMSFHGPIPDPPSYTDWLFALDLDGDTATGRPAGSAQINQDLGDEAVIGAIYDPAVGEYEPYLLTWDTAQGGWSDGPEVVRFYISEPRTLIALAVPLDTLTQTVSQTAGVELLPDAVKGRAAVLSFVEEQAVIDFFPERSQ